MSKINSFLGSLQSKKDTNKNKSGNIDDIFGSSGNTKDNSHLGLQSFTQDDDENIVGFVNDLFLRAISKGVSDIHIEPNEKNINIRFRIDGNFVVYKELDLTKLNSLVARIKILAFLKIDEQRLPQDGKIAFNMFAGKTVDLRISVMPTIYGEKIVIRVLKKDDKPPVLTDLGLLPYNMVKIKKHLQNSHGMILAVGPTGSGKSTTLFSLLSQFDASQKNISTLEDPVEYRIPGVNHTQINPSIGFDFSAGLRSLLRQDPDIIMVGEIRDSETAKLAVESSITGHLVFSTLHTNSAVHTLQRLVNLGIDPLLIASSLKLIISQRLVRKLCPHCKVEHEPTIKEKSFLISKIGRYIKDKENLKIYSSKEGGCEKCNNTGYKGRLGVYEVFEMNEKIEELLIKNSSRTQIEIQAIGDGMVPIFEDGLLKVILGDTSINEIFRALGNN